MMELVRPADGHRPAEFLAVRGKTQAALMIFASYLPRLLFGAP